MSALLNRKWHKGQPKPNDAHIAFGNLTPEVQAMITGLVARVEALEAGGGGSVIPANALLFNGSPLMFNGEYLTFN